MKNLDTAKAQIEAGAKWNGQIYAKNVGNGKNNVDVFIYLDGNYVSFGRHFKTDLQEVKDLAYAALFPATAKAVTKTNIVSELTDFHNYCEGQD